MRRGRGDVNTRVRCALLLLLVVEAASLSAQDTAPADLARRSKGAPSAPVTVYEMSDFQCPYCRRFALETFPTLDREYVATGKVRWVFINFPLTSVHPNAVAAAEAALCASKQRAFWPMHDLLYRYQETWAPLKNPGAFLLSLADSAKISRPAMLACLKAPETTNQVRADAQGAARAGATSTPTFYIEGGLLTGAQPLALFKHVLDSVYVVQNRPTAEGGRR
jgi:protein-disulfide isomerase